MDGRHRERSRLTQFGHQPVRRIPRQTLKIVHHVHLVVVIKMVIRKMPGYDKGAGKQTVFKHECRRELDFSGVGTERCRLLVSH